MEERDLTGADIVKAAHDGDFPLTNQSVERGATLPDDADGAQNVAAGDLVGIGLLFARKPLIRAFTGASVDELLDLRDQAVEIAAAGGLGCGLVAGDQVHRGIHRTTAGVAHDDNQL